MTVQYDQPLQIRLRARIDEVTDARDKALELLWEARSDIESLEAQLANKPTRCTSCSEVRKSRDMWRKRARDAERMQRERPTRSGA